MCLIAKFSMVQEQWCTIGGDGHPEESPIGGSWSPQTVRGIQGNQGSHGTHREGLQKQRGPVDWNHCKWRQLTRTDFSISHGHDGPRAAGGEGVGGGATMPQRMLVMVSRDQARPTSSLCTLRPREAVCLISESMDLELAFKFWLSQAL